MRERLRASPGLALTASWIIRVSLGLLLGLIALFVTILLVEPRFDLTPYRATIGQHLSALAGREVRFDGDLRVVLGRHVHLTAADVNVANPDWAESGELLRAAEAALGIDLYSLLSGVIQLEGVVLHDAAASLEVSTDGVRSWDLGVADPRDEDTFDDGPDWRIVIGDVRAENVTLAYSDPAAERPPLQIHIARFEQNQDAAGMLQIAVSGTANDLAVGVEGSVGPLASLLGGHHIDVDLRARLNQATVSLRGHLGEPQRLEDIDLDGTLRGPSLANVLNALGISNQQTGDIDLAFKVMDRERGFAWASSGRAGSLVLETRGEVERPLELNDLHATVSASGEDLALFGRLSGIGSLPAESFRLDGVVVRDANGLELSDVQLVSGDARLLLSGKLPAFPRLDDANTRIEIVMPEPAKFAALIGRRLTRLGPLRASATLAASGGKALLEATGDGAGHHLSLHGPLGNYPDFAGSRLGFELAGPSIAAFGGVISAAGLSDAGYRIAGTLRVDDDARLMLQLDEARAGELQVTAQGSLGTLPQLTDMDLAVALRAASLRRAAGATSESPLPAQSFEIKTRVSGQLLGNLHIGDVSGRLGRATFEVTGKIETMPKFAGSDAHFSVQIPQLDELIPAATGSQWGRDGYRLAGRIRSAQGLWQFDEVEIEGGPLPVRLGGKLRATANGFAVDDLRADLAGGEISAQLGIERRARPYVDLVASARRLDLARILASVAAADKAAATAGKGRLIPDTPLPLGVLDNVDGRFLITGEALRYPDPAFPDQTLVRDLALDANLERGSLVLRKLRLSGDRGALEVNGTLKQAKSTVAADAVLQVRDFRYGVLARGAGFDLLPRHQIDGQLTAKGGTWRELAASSNGKLRLTGGKGQVMNAGLDKALGDFLMELMGAINPFVKKEPFTRIECTAAALQVSDGIVQLVPGFVTRTDKLDIAAAGLIDLKTERIDIQFKAAPRSGIGLSAAGLVHPYVKVGGSLAQPGLVFDSTGALISGGAAVATAGLSIVAKSLFDRVSGAVTDPCAQLIATADQGAPTAVVGNPLDAVKKGSGKIGTPAAAPPPGPAK